MVHSRDDEEVGMAHEVKTPEQFSQTMMRQYWLGFGGPEMLSKSCHGILNFFI